METTSKAFLALTFGATLLAAGPVLSQDATVKKHIPLQKTIGQVTPTGPVPSLFVLNSDGATLADGKLTLTGVSMNSITFADRPVRAAGHVMTAQFIEQWDEGKDNFAIDPPNATVSILGGVGSDISDAVVTLIKPTLDGTTLTFEVKVLEGQLAGSGPAALFIDDRGGGGGRGGDFGGGRNFSGNTDVHVNNFNGGGGYYHAPDYHGAWYGAGGVVAGAAVGAAVGASIANNRDEYPLCGYYPYPPCY